MAGIYKRGRMWWGRFEAHGAEHRRSLRTADRQVAEMRLVEWQRSVIAEPPAEMPPAISHSVVGHVYAIGYNDKVNIGWTQGDAAYRLRILQPNHPETLTLFGSAPGRVADEKALHRRFAAQRIRGEWFRAEGPVMQWIADGCPIHLASSPG